jgi:hypothetical protein
MPTAVLVIVTVVIFFWIILGIIACNAYQEVHNAPKDGTMLYCPVHGPLRRKHVLTFLSSPVCWKCWAEKVEAARKGRLK